jgi:hypothetical protein
MRGGGSRGLNPGPLFDASANRSECSSPAKWSVIFPVGMLFLHPHGIVYANMGQKKI